ncbi:MAG TPA: four helix bundle protein [Candidatus Binatia bacterium]|nr:four helix bundle protein [Candidatus Binatia bacterium]
MQIKNFEDLEIWKIARRLTQEVYTLARTSKLSRDYNLRDQMQRAAVSIMSNIAEGFERGGNQEFVQFLYVAKASCGELRSQLYVTLDQKYIDPQAANEMTMTLKQLSMMIKHLIDHLKQSGMRGPKYGSSTSPRSSEMS